MTYAMRLKQSPAAAVTMRCNSVGHVASRTVSRHVVQKVSLRMVNKRRFLFMMSCLGVVLILMASILSARANTTTESPTDFIVVMAGDTLWEIAETHCTRGDLRDYIADVRELNALEDNTIYAGQGLLLPVR